MQHFFLIMQIYIYIRINKSRLLCYLLMNITFIILLFILIIGSRRSSVERAAMGDKIRGNLMNLSASLDLPAGTRKT